MHRFCNLMMRDRPLPIHGDGKNLRNFLFAADAARAFDVVLHKAEVRLSSLTVPWPRPFPVVKVHVMKRPHLRLLTLLLVLCFL